MPLKFWHTDLRFWLSNYYLHTVKMNFVPDVVHINATMLTWFLWGKYCIAFAPSWPQGFLGTQWLCEKNIPWLWPWQITPRFTWLIHTSFLPSIWHLYLKIRVLAWKWWWKVVYKKSFWNSCMQETIFT